MTVPRTGRPGSIRAAAPSRSGWRTQAPVVAVVALGGGTGAAARYAASLWWPTPAGGFPGRPSGSTPSAVP